MSEKHIDSAGIEFHSRWKVCKLGDLCSKIGSGATPTGGSQAYKTKGISLIRSQNVLDFKFGYDGLAFIDDVQALALKNVIVKESDILLNITGDSVARVCKVPREVLPARVNQHVAILRPKKDKLNNDFLLYQLQAKKESLLILSEIGGTRNALTKVMIEDFEIELPPLPEQTAIANILSSLDDKIDLLHRQNKTLEQLAETLFRQWFVEEAEESWEEKSIFDVIELIGGGTPKTDNGKYWDGEIKWLSCGDIASNHKSFVMFTEKAITDLGLQNCSAKLLPKYSMVISARGTVGKYCLISEPMAFSQSNYGIKPKYESCYFFTYLLVAYSVEELKAAAYGSVFDTITTSTFKGLKVYVPGFEPIKQFEEKITPYFNKILSNQTQIRTLTQTRDTLLPKLMNGEVRVEM